jgi:hypothetical protein
LLLLLLLLLLCQQACVQQCSRQPHHAPAVRCSPVAPPTTWASSGVCVAAAMALSTPSSSCRLLLVLLLCKLPGGQVLLHFRVWSLWLQGVTGVRDTAAAADVLATQPAVFLPATGNCCGSHPLLWCLAAWSMSAARCAAAFKFGVLLVVQHACCWTPPTIPGANAITWPRYHHLQPPSPLPVTLSLG